MGHREGGHAFNALPQVSRATVNCRVLPGESMDEVRKTLVEVIADDQISVTPTWTHVASKPSSLAPELTCPADIRVASPATVISEPTRS